MSCFRRWFTRLWWLPLLLLSVVACADTGPLSLGGHEDALFSEPFGPVEGEWLLENDELSRAYMANEQLLIEVDAPNLVHYVTLDSEQFGDFTLDVSVTQLSGDRSSSFGVLFRIQEIGGFYRLAVTGDGQYQVELRRTDGSVVSLTDGWQQTSSLRRDLGQPNDIRVVARGNEFQFYANNLLLTELSDSSLGQGKIALDAGTFGRTGLQVAFDDLIVSP